MTVRPRSDLAAIEAAYADGYRGYLRLAAAVSGRHDRAADMVQEAFARAVRARGSFHGQGSLEGWIARIVVNVARDEAGRPPAPPMAPVSQPAADEVPALAPRIAALPERQRLVLFLRYYADLPYDAIAAAVGIEVSTVGPTVASYSDAVSDWDDVLRRTPADRRFRPTRQPTRSLSEGRSCLGWVD